ncbi:hypothetical protein [Nonomuraea salmonea]|uniref:hypothetical protein n=1 Tax=Nonomuraea salmonea TaxID=46181 RepID=UPI0031E9AD62
MSIADDPDRAPARSHLYAMGLSEEEMRRPVVGIASTWTGTMPCNLNHRDLAEHVAEGCARRVACRWSSTRSPSPTTSPCTRPACARR